MRGRATAKLTAERMNSGLQCSAAGDNAPGIWQLWNAKCSTHGEPALSHPLLVSVAGTQKCKSHQDWSLSAQPRAQSWSCHICSCCSGPARRSPASLRSVQPLMQIRRIPLALDSHLHEFARDSVDTLQKCSELGTEQTKRNSSKGGGVWFQPQITVLIRKGHKSTQFKQCQQHPVLLCVSPQGIYSFLFRSAISILSLRFPEATASWKTFVGVLILNICMASEGAEHVTVLIKTPNYCLAVTCD